MNPTKINNFDTFEFGLSFDDVLLKPNYSEVLPNSVDISTKLTKKLRINLPIISAAMDSVTEFKLAIAMAQFGGVGVIHKNLTVSEQSKQIMNVKKFESGMVVNPLTISPESSLNEALKIMKENKISSVPVILQNKKLVGILTNRDVRFAKNLNEKVSNLMTKNVVTVNRNISKDDAKKLLHKHRIEKLVVVDNNYFCKGLITVKDIKKSEKFPLASKDKDGRLLAAAAIGTGTKEILRSESLINSGADIIVIDTAHGHSKKVLETLKELKELSNEVQIICGNIATADAAMMLIEAGADAIKVGIGPGSICTTRIVAGVGVPQLSSILNVSKVCREKNIPLISDGGIKFSGDLSKAIAAGADTVMIGSLLAGTDESPGEIYLYNGRSYKSYRGMGSIGAMSRGSADRYFQSEINDNLKFVPEGVEGQVPYKGPVSNILHQLSGGLKSAMGYTGNKNIEEMQKNCIFQQISTSGLNESHVHNVEITKEAPNYRKNL